MGDKYIPCGQKELSELEAIVQSIELWEYLAEDASRLKADWPGWRERGYAKSLCPLCEYEDQQQEVERKASCAYCPYNKLFGHCCLMHSPYHKWEHAADPKDREAYAKLFLEQLHWLKDACHE